MADKSNGKKNGSGTTLDLMGEEEAPTPRPARKAAAPQIEPAPTAVSEPAPIPDAGGALFGGDDVDLAARHPADVPVGGFPAPSQIAQVPEQLTELDPFAEEDPFEDSIMARMLADEPAPLLSPLRAAREDLNAAVPEITAAPEMMTEPEIMTEPDLEAFADPVAVPEVEQAVDFAPAPEAAEGLTDTMFAEEAFAEDKEPPHARC